MLSIKQEFVWGPTQQDVFDKWKAILSSQTVLGVFDPGKQAMVTADASSHGLDTMLKQKQEGSKFKA